MKMPHILFIVENNPVPQDVRVWNEALTAKECGYKVSVICPSDDDHRTSRSLEGVRIYRHPCPREGSSKWSMIVEYLNAPFWELLFSFRIFIANPFQIIHGANPPDHIFLISFLFRLFGVKYIFDHHDISPENYVAKFGKKDFIFKILLVMERLNFKAADLVISTNESYKRIAIERGKKKESDIIVVRNGPNLALISSTLPNPELRRGFRYLVGYVGNIGQQEGIENLLAVVDYIVKKKERADIKFIIVGKGPHLQNVIAQSMKMGIGKYVFFTGYVSDKELYEVLATSDVCVNPEFRNDFTDKSTMIKIMEYMTFSKPIVQFDTAEGRLTAGDSAVYIRENDTGKFAEELIALLDDPERRKRMGTLGRKRVEERLEWGKQKQYLQDAYRRALSI